MDALQPFMVFFSSKKNEKGCIEMKKKLLALSLALSMILGLAACGSSSASAGASAAPAATASGSAAPAETGTTEKRTLRVAMECGYAPYNWTQTDDSNGAVPIADSTDYAYGYDVMMAKYICEQLGWDLQVVKLDWESIIPAIQSGTVDVGICGQSITSDRLQMVDFTQPYYYASIVCVTKKDGKFASAKGISDLAGGVCTSQLNTVWYDTCLPQISNADIQPAQESAPAMLVALESDRVDYICTDMPTAMAAVAAYPDLTILDFTDTDDNFQVSDEEINIGISVQKGNTEVTDAINGVLSTLTKDDFTNMMNEAISVQPLSN